MKLQCKKCERPAVYLATVNQSKPREYCSECLEDEVLKYPGRVEIVEVVVKRKGLR